MDGSRFDELTAGFTRSSTRRGAIAGLIGATLLGAPTRVAGKRRVKSEAVNSCFPGMNCTPGKGRNNSSCDFSGSAVFLNKDARGANLSNANFTGADLAGADFRGANLSGSCFVDADLRNARLGAAVNLHNAVFCGTVMPDGAVNNDGCGRQTTCCPCPDGNCTRPPGGAVDCEGTLKRAGCELINDGVSIVWKCRPGTDLRNADLHGCSMLGAQLRGVLLDGAVLNSALLNNARLDGARLIGASMVQVTVVQTHFDNASLRDADLREADMREGVYINANLFNADLGDARLNGANFQGADLRARAWRQAICPDGIRAGSPTRRTCCNNLNGHTARACS